MINHQNPITMTMEIVDKSSKLHSLAMFDYQRVPSGKRLHDYGKSAFLMGKLARDGNFNSAVLNYQRANGIFAMNR